MPVQVQLPGYNHTAPAVGLAQAIGAGFGAYKDYNQGQQAQAQTAGVTQANEQAKTEFDTKQKILKAQTTPSTFNPDGTPLALNPVTENARAAGLADVLSIGNAGLLKPQETEPLLAAIKDPNQTAMGINQIMEPLRATAQPLASEKLKADATKNVAQTRIAPQNDKNKLQANAQYSEEIQPYESTINSANRVRGIIEKIKSGGLKSTPTLANDLSSATASMFNNGKAATVHGQESNQLTSMEGSAAQKYGYATGKAMDTVSPAQLDQLYKDAGALRDEFSYTHKSMFDSLKQGVPQQFQPDLQKRFDSFRKSSVDSSHSKSESDAEHSQAVKWAKANPNDPRSAQILSINGVK